MTARVSRLLVRALVLLWILTLAGNRHAFDVGAQTPAAEAAPTIEASTEATVDFPRGVILTGRLDLAGLEPEPSGQVQLLYRISDSPTLHLAPAVADSAAPGAVTATIDLQTAFAPAGVDLSVFWRLPLVGGGYADSEPATVAWVDNRWPWRSMTSEQVTLNYFDHDEAFATSVLESAQATITDLERRFDLGRSAPLRIWLYPSRDTFQGAQQPNSREAVAGASYPGYFLIAAIVPDGDFHELGRVIPHEVSHQVLFQATKNPFTLPPLWFDEGLATHYQVGGTDRFLPLVSEALERDALFDITALDTAFPYASQQATLAYATSWSILAYIRAIHGDEAIGRMIAAFRTGMPYADAIESALWLSRPAMDREWRAWIGAQSAASGTFGRAA